MCDFGPFEIDPCNSFRNLDIRILSLLISRLIILHGASKIILCATLLCIVSRLYLYLSLDVGRIGTHSSVYYQLPSANNPTEPLIITFPQIL